jgi:hypothetical protein
MSHFYSYAECWKYWGSHLYCNAECRYTKNHNSNCFAYHLNWVSYFYCYSNCHLYLLSYFLCSASHFCYCYSECHLYWWSHFYCIAEYCYAQCHIFTVVLNVAKPYVKISIGLLRVVHTECHIFNFCGEC